jgi:hypothetical protein
MRVFENRVPRRTCGPKKNEMMGGCRKLHNEELHNLHSSLNIIRMIKPKERRWAGKKKNLCRILVGKLQANFLTM